MEVQKLYRRPNIDIKQLVYGIVVGLAALFLAYLPIVLNTPEKSSFNEVAGEISHFTGFISFLLMLWSIKTRDDNEVEEKPKGEVKEKTE